MSSITLHIGSYTLGAARWKYSFGPTHWPLHPELHTRSRTSHPGWLRLPALYALDETYQAFVDALATGPEKLPSADEWLQQKAAADAQAAQDGPAQTPLQQFLREKQLLRVKVGGAMRCGVLPLITPDPQRTSFVAGHDSHWRASVAGCHLTPQLAPPHAQARRQRELDKIAAKKKLLRDREEERRRQRMGGKPLRASSSSRETAAAAEEAKKKKEGLKWAPVPTASVWGSSKSAGVGRDRACVGRMSCCPPSPHFVFFFYPSPFAK